MIEIDWLGPDIVDVLMGVLRGSKESDLMKQYLNLLKKIFSKNKILGPSRFVFNVILWRGGIEWQWFLVLTCGIVIPCYYYLITYNLYNLDSQGRWPVATAKRAWKYGRIKRVSSYFVINGTEDSQPWRGLFQPVTKSYGVRIIGSLWLHYWLGLIYCQFLYPVSVLARPGR